MAAVWVALTLLVLVFAALAFIGLASDHKARPDR